MNSLLKFLGMMVTSKELDYIESNTQIVMRIQFIYLLSWKNEHLSSARRIVITGNLGLEHSIVYSSITALNHFMAFKLIVYSM